ncbi:MAG: hypothetical protein WD576_03550 [Nitriliruptoraceae bacterium]
MNRSVRSVLVGLVGGVVMLLLLDLARILTQAHARDGGETSAWWPIACYAVVGVILSAIIAAGNRDRVISGVSGGVVLLFLLPTLPLQLAAWVPSLLLVPATAVQQAIAVVVVAACAYAALRGPRA